MQDSAAVSTTKFMMLAAADPPRMPMASTKGLDDVPAVLQGIMHIKTDTEPMNSTRIRVMVARSTRGISRSGCSLSSAAVPMASVPVSYTHLRAHETDSYLVCRLLLE